MSVRDIKIDCTHPDCSITVATGVLTDSLWVWEIGLDDSVTEAFALSNGMPFGGFNRAVVNHTEVDDVVQHTITEK